MTHDGYAYDDDDSGARIAALAAHLGYEPDAYEPAAWGENTFTDGGAEYLVLTDEESDAACREYVRESVWAFNSDFLASFTGIPAAMFAAIQDRCEDANEPFLQVIESTDGGLEEFVSEAIAADGRGHFLASWDGHEIELTGTPFYAYRSN